MKRFSLACLALFFVSSCSNQKSSPPLTLLQQEKKPLVVLVPVIDHSKSNLEWDISDELTASLAQRLTQRNNFTLVPIQKVKNRLKKLHPKDDPFASSLTWMKSVFEGTQFIIFTELMEHDEVPRAETPLVSMNLQECSSDLNTSMRVRVVDLRSEEPRVILQEIIHDSHHIPRQFTRINFYQVAWGSDRFAISPLGLAHSELIKMVSSRLEEYILRASSS